MTNRSAFSDFTTRLREFIYLSQSRMRNAKCEIESEPTQKFQGRARHSVRATIGNPPSQRRARSDAPYQLTQFIAATPDARPWASLHFGDCEFNRLALELFALQFAHNAPYRRFCLGRGTTPESVTDWTHIPAIPTSAFKELELSCLPTEERSAVFHSSGTTEQRPSRHFHNAESLTIYEASLLTWFDTKVLKPKLSGSNELGNDRSPSPRPSPSGEGESSARKPSHPNFRIVSLTPSLTEAPHSSLVFMFDAVCRKFALANSGFLGKIGRDGAWELNFDAVIAALGSNRRSKKAETYGLPAGPPPYVGGYDLPVVLLGTAFSFVQLFEFLAERNIRFKLPPGSRVLETGGYKGRSRELPKAELHALITERLGVPLSDIICEYGMSELSSQAYDTQIQNSQSGIENQDRTFRFPPWARVKIVSPETGREVGQGETGLIRIFDLANVYSVMAIETEDLGVRRGAGFELLGRAKAAEPRGCSLMMS